jgi:hypothetical protein
MSLKNKMLQIWDTMARSSSGLQDKGCTRSRYHFRLKNTFLEDNFRYLLKMHNLLGSKPLQDKRCRRWRHLHLGMTLLGKECTLVAARSRTIRLDM